MERLAQTILTTVEIMESDASISLNEAADKACEIHGYDELATTPVYLLLENSRQDILCWAKELDNY